MASTVSFPLERGTLLPEGEIVALTLTSYEVRTADGGTEFVPFVRAHARIRGEHAPKFVQPLVIFG